MLQRVAPTGVGARDLRECLLLQLAEIKQRGEPELAPFVEEIIDKYLTELGEHKFTMIAHTLGTNYDSVVAVRDFIKRYMSPHPAYEPGSGRSWATPSPVRFVAPRSTGTVLVVVADRRKVDPSGKTINQLLKLTPK